MSAAAEIVDESFLNPEEMDAFVQRGLFRAPTWIVRKTGDTPDDPKFTYHRLEFKGANWFGFIKISIVGTQHRSPGSCYYSVSVFVRQTDGPMFMAGNDHTEIAVRFPNEPGLPMPESLYPYLEAALDEYTDKVNLYLDGKDELARFARQVSMSIIHYLQGARIIKEAVEPEPQDLREDEDNLYGPEEMEQFAQVALDAGYASSWRKANGGVQPNRFIDVWVCELRIPIPERAFSGHLAVFRGTEAPWIIHITLESDQHAHAKYIIGYTHTEPTPKFLDKIRAGAVKIINRWVTGSVVPCQAQSMADEIANYVQAECAGDPEVYAWNYPGRVRESIEDVDAWATDFFKYEGIGEWQTRPYITSGLVDFQDSSILNFKFGNVQGYITFSAFTHVEQRNQVQEIRIEVIDNSALETHLAAFVSNPLEGGWFKFRVPPDQFDQAKAALREFVADYLKPLAVKLRVMSLIPTYKSAINRKFLNTMSPWFVVQEDLASELGDEFIAHGGAPLGWEAAAGGWKLKFPWLDRSHVGVITLRRLQFTANNDLYQAVLRINRRNEAGVYGEVFSTSTLVRLKSGRQMAQFQDRTIELAKWLLATFSQDVPAKGEAKQMAIKQKFDMATNWAGVNEDFDPEEVMQGFDFTASMKPWTKEPGRRFNNVQAQTTWRTVIQHKDRERPFNDKVELFVTNFQYGFAIVEGSYWIRGWTETKIGKPITIKSDDGPMILDIVETVARAILVPQVVQNKLSKYYILSFRAQLRVAFKRRGIVTESVACPEIVEVVQGLQFRSENRGSHHGQSDMTLFAELDGEVVGRIDYSVYGGQVQVQWIKSNPSLRRQGIATAMAKQLQSEYPTQEIEWSASTDMGTGFIQALDREFQADPTYDQLKAAYDKAKAEYGALEAEFNAYDGPPLNQNPEMFKKGERMNEIDTFLFDLEARLRDMKPGKWMIREMALDQDKSAQDVVSEALEWSPEEVAGLAAKATSCTVEWLPPRSDTDDWIMLISAPYGQLCGENSRIKMRFFVPDSDGLQRVRLDFYLVSPRWTKHGGGQGHISHYDHINFNRQFVIKPEDGEALRAAVEAKFFQTAGNAITRSVGREFNLKQQERKLKIGFRRLERQFCAGDWIPPG